MGTRNERGMSECMSEDSRQVSEGEHVTEWLSKWVTTAVSE